MWRPFGPTTSSTSASISSCRTPSPTPTLRASSPSFATPASSPSAFCTDGGSPSMPWSLAATDAADTVLMRLVLLSSWTWFRTHHGPNGTGRGGRTAASSSTSYGTTSLVDVRRLKPPLVQNEACATSAVLEGGHEPV